MTVNSRAKGGRVERLLSAAMVEAGLSRDADTRRTAQRCGVGNTADVVGIDGLHIECKGVERLNIWAAMAQAVRDAGGKAIPSVWFKRNRTGFMVCVRMEDVESFARAIVASVERAKGAPDDEQ